MLQESALAPIGDIGYENVPFQSGLLINTPNIQIHEQSIQNFREQSNHRQKSTSLIYSPQIMKGLEKNISTSTIMQPPVADQKEH